MILQESTVAIFFHSDDTLSKRKKVCEHYAQKFEIQLFKVGKTQEEPKISYLGKSEEEYEQADGLFVGEEIMV